LGEQHDIASELDAVAKKLILTKGQREVRIADIVALLSIAGMIYTFISSQSALQAAIGLKLDLLEREIAELRKTADPVPMMVYKVDALARSQEENERQRQMAMQDLREMHDSLIAMGINLKGKR
jgi:hypothetical protein